MSVVKYYQPATHITVYATSYDILTYIQVYRNPDRIINYSKVGSGFSIKLRRKYAIDIVKSILRLDDHELYDIVVKAQKFCHGCSFVDKYQLCWECT